jgi:histone-lysine N-methyltransferase SETD8
MFYFKKNEKRYCIDATQESPRLGRLLNHSRRRANLEAKVLVLKGQPHLIFTAKRKILSNEELLYDYGDRSKVNITNHPWLAE